MDRRTQTQTSDMSTESLHPGLYPVIFSIAREINFKQCVYQVIYTNFGLPRELIESQCPSVCHGDKLSRALIL